LTILLFFLRLDVKKSAIVGDAKHSINTSS